MAKLSFSERRLRVKTTDRVREIRQRYGVALSMGHSVAEASRLANGFEKILPPGADEQPKRSLPRLPLPEPGGDQTGSETSLSPAVKKPKFDIPANYQDLPWPRLVALAKSVTGFEDHIRSRAHACQLIEAKLNEE